MNTSIDTSSPVPMASSPSLPAASIGKAYAFRHVGAPLLSAVMEVRALIPDTPAGSRQEGDAAAFAQLVEATAQLTREAAGNMGVADIAQEDSTRVTLAAAASTVVASHYRATGKVALGADAKAFALAVKEAVASVGEPSPDRSVASFGPGFVTAKSLAGLAPAVAAVSRYAFGRTEQDLLKEIAQHLQKAAQNIVQKMMNASLSSEEHQALYATALDVAGHLYAESHYIEADRLLDMTPEERANYVKQHNNQIPMDPVWAKFDQHVSMLTTLMQHVNVPENPALHSLNSEA